MTLPLTHSYLACYTFNGSAGKYGTGDYTFTAADLTPATVSECRQLLRDRLRIEGVRSPSVTFTSIIRLDTPAA